MNQILMTGENRKKSYNSNHGTSINRIVRFFAIVILFFGIILVGQGSYAMVKNMTSTPPVPTINIEQIGSNVILKIQSSTPIKQVVYSINGEEVSIQGRNRNQIGENLDLELGENKIKVQITDKNGNVTTNEQVYYWDSAPTIELTGDGKKAKITVRDDMQISYIEYWWDNEEKTKVEATEETTTILETKLDIEKGERTLNVVAVDNNNNKSEEQQIYKGVTKPTIELEQNGSEVSINVSDETGLSIVEYQVNDKYTKKEDVNAKDGKYVVDLEEGQNAVAVRVTNTDGLVAEYVERFNN